MQHHFTEHLQTAVTIIAKLFDLWSQKYENGAGRNFGHFVTADIAVVEKSESLVARGWE